MPILNVACVFRMKSFSSMPSRALKARMGGIVASPTPIVPISGDSIRVIFTKRSFRVWDRAAAAIHPALPPPTMMMPRMRLSESARGFISGRTSFYERFHRVVFAGKKTIGDELKWPRIHVGLSSFDQIRKAPIDRLVFAVRVLNFVSRGDRSVDGQNTSAA